MPARLAESQKKSKGTNRPGRTLKSPAAAALTKAPAPPLTLSQDAVAEWKALAGILVKSKTLAGADLRALELLCETLASATQFAEVIRKNGPTVTAAGGGTKSHPALQAMATARAQARALLTDFGLTPRGRQGVAEAPGGAGSKPWDDSRFFKD